MPASSGISRARVIETGIEVLETHRRVSDVGLREVAERLNLRTQSLYAHVEGVEDLRRALALEALSRLSAHLLVEVGGRAGRDAISSIARAYYAFAMEHPGLYDAVISVRRTDPAINAASDDVTRAMRLAFRAYDLDPVIVIRWNRIVFAGVHGLVGLVNDEVFTTADSPVAALERMIRAFLDGIELDAAASRENQDDPAS
ncbi:MAG: putative transcriptional regulator, TetR family [Actinomycetia bacterium]|nr:putative transcriptional regulator, TetR family [Actinomycetes bacterium]